ncbi:hypothetical protein JB92DRAFT_3136058 [Gautieria morchelliformis]|nr:hypothetical protein JB92DRAFT_3136058 [Gautieria morchelliformis]
MWIRSLLCGNAGGNAVLSSLINSTLWLQLWDYQISRRQHIRTFGRVLTTQSASVIAVLQLTAATISACLSYESGVKNASRDKRIIIDRLFGLQKVLETVRRLVEDDETAASSRLPALNELLLRCGGELGSLNTTLERDLGRKGRMQALIWPLNESEVHQTLDKLGKLQDLLTTSMDIDQTRLTLKIDMQVVILKPEHPADAAADQARPSAAPVR